ncbi:DUF4179 domain-containing protein [Peribacillus deserti]|nr:DUF4179 domain-containing protein [Peribacillus deserti]
MDNKDLKLAIEQIEVPKEKVLKAIESGLNKAGGIESSPVKKKTMVSTIAAAAVLGITFSSGFVNPTMNGVLAKTPLIGGIFQKFEDSMGVELSKQNLVTELNQSVTRNGLTVKLDSAYFDGEVVSITGRVEGDVDKGHNEKGEISFDMNFENHKGDNDPWLNGKSTEIRKAENGYMFLWKMVYPFKTFKENFTLPVTIHNINGIKGEWEFVIPVNQENLSRLTVNQEKSYAEEGIKIGIKDILVAKASSALIYETVFKNEDEVYLEKAIDDKGNVYHFGNSTILSKSKEDGFHEIVRSKMTKVHPDISSLTFYPSLHIADPKAVQILDRKTFTLNSKRTSLSLRINDAWVEGDNLVLDYQFHGFPNELSKDKLDLIKNNLAYEFMLVDKDYVDTIDPENPVPPESHIISRNKVTVLNEKTSHYQSVFKLNGEQRIDHFKMENTVLQFDFSSFIENKKIAPFSVKIPRQNK